MTLDPELLSILACPACRGPLDPLALPGSPSFHGADQADSPQGLACARCSVVYPVRDEIPVMLAEEAVSRREWDAGKRQSASTPG